jgi:hypothetical protein
MDHVYLTHERCSHEGCCPVCDGGLGICTVCGCLEGSLATQYPGVHCYNRHGELIYIGMVDFRNGRRVSLIPDYTVDELVAASRSQRVAICERLAVDVADQDDIAHRRVRVARWMRDVYDPPARRTAV